MGVVKNRIEFLENERDEVEIQVKKVKGDVEGFLKILEEFGGEIKER